MQGVFYRANAKKQADDKGVTGWVQNTPGGDVEMVASADAEALAQFIEWCYKGTTRAKVETIEKTDLDEQTFVEFTIKR